MAVAETWPLEVALPDQSSLSVSKRTSDGARIAKPSATELGSLRASGSTTAPKEPASPPTGQAMGLVVTYPTPDRSWNQSRSPGPRPEPVRQYHAASPPALAAPGETPSAPRRAMLIASQRRSRRCHREVPPQW